MKALYVLFILCFNVCLCEYNCAISKDPSCHLKASVDEDSDPYLHTLKCDSIFTNLVRINHENYFMASAFVREFFETMRCDDVFNMTYHRQKYAIKINLGDNTRMFRVLNFTTSETDELIVAQVLLQSVVFTL
jgi:hypothetical protein